MRRVTSKSVIARDFVFKPKYMFGGRALPEPAERALALPTLHFQVSNVAKTFSGRAPPGPAGGA